MSLFNRPTGGPRVRLPFYQPLQFIPRESAASRAQAEALVAYGSAANLLCDIVSMLPVSLQRPGRDGWVNVDSEFLTDPGGEGYGVHDWLFQVIHAGCFSGNAVGYVERAATSDEPQRVLLVHPDDVTAWWGADGEANWLIRGVPVEREVLWHFRRYPRPAGLLSVSPVARYAQTLGLAFHSEEFGAKWFSDGAHPSSLLYSDKDISADTAEVVKQRWKAAFGNRNRDVAVLSGGLQWQKIQLAPEESQFLQTQQFSAAQVCRILGPALAEILGYATGDSKTYKNREQIAIDLLTYTVDPWLTKLEASLATLFRGPARIKFDRAALLRTDMLTRYQAHRIALGPLAAFETQNEIRALEDLPPLPGGDDLPTPSTYPVDAQPFPPSGASE